MHKLVFAVGAASCTCLACICLACPATACQSTNFILDETFKTPDAGWDAPDKFVSYGAAGLSMTATPNSGYFTLNKNYTSDMTDICTTIVWPAELDKASNKSLVSVGIIFWAKDYKNFYRASVYADGSVKIIRDVAGNLSIVQYKLGKGLNIARIAASDKNEIEVQIVGAHAKVFLNDKSVLDINGQPPSGSGNVGLHVSEGESAFPIVYTKFQVATMP